MHGGAALIVAGPFSRFRHPIMKPPPLPEAPLFVPSSARGAGGEREASASEPWVPSSGQASSVPVRSHVRPPPPLALPPDSPYAAVVSRPPPDLKIGVPRSSLELPRLSPPPPVRSSGGSARSSRLPGGEPPRSPHPVLPPAPLPPPTELLLRRVSVSAAASTVAQDAPQPRHRAQRGPASVPPGEQAGSAGFPIRRRYYDPGLLRQLTNELERRFAVEELLELVAQQGGGGTGQIVLEPGFPQARPALARRLVETAIEEDSVLALLDAVRCHHADLHPLLQLHVSAGVAGAPALERGDELGGYLLLRELDRDVSSANFWARRDGADYRLQVLGYYASVDSARLQRLRHALRRAAGVSHPALESNVRLESLDGLYAVVADYKSGQLLSERLSVSGGMAFGAARKLLRKVLEPVVKLHEAGVIHGQLAARNILVLDSKGEHDVQLLGLGRNWLWDGTLAHAPTLALAPELIKGAEPTPASDVYALAALIYELLTGQPLFSAGSPQELLMAHLSETPPGLDALDGARALPSNVERLVLRALDKDPHRRPGSAGEFLAELQSSGGVSLPPPPRAAAALLDERLASLREIPADRRRLLEVLQCVRSGAEARGVGDALWRLAHDLGDTSEPDVRVRLLEEAAHVYLSPGAHPGGAKSAYLAALEIHPGDLAILSPLAALYEELKEFESLVELTRAHASKIVKPGERARLLTRTAVALESGLGDFLAALDMYVEAFCLDPEERSLAVAIERLAGAHSGGWARVIEACLAYVAPTPGTPMTAGRLTVLNALARWYDLSGDLAAAEQSWRMVLEAVDVKGKAPASMDPLAEGDRLTADAAGDNTSTAGQLVLRASVAFSRAFESLSALLRRQQRFDELGALLVELASRPYTPPVEARDMLAEAATVYGERLGAWDTAVSLYRRVFDIDPGHNAAAEGLLGYLLERQDWSEAAALQVARAEVKRGESRCQLLCAAARIWTERVGEVSTAAALYRRALEASPGHREPLDALAQLLAGGGRFQELLDVLIHQLDLVATPRQKAALWVRIACLYEGEYLDRHAAINAYEKALTLAPSAGEALEALVRLYAADEDWTNVVSACRGLLALRDGEAHRATGLALAELLVERLGDWNAAVLVLEGLCAVHPDDPELLLRLAELRMGAGDLEGALALIDEVGDHVDDDEKGAHYYAVGRLLDRAGHTDEALERYKAAVEENPAARAFVETLREAYEQAGDYAALAELLKSDLRRVRGAQAQARLYGELARLYHERLRDDAEAEQMAIRAQGLDASNLDANLVRGVIAYRAERYGAAAQHLQHLAPRLDRLGADGARVGTMYARALQQSGRAELALEAISKLQQERPGELSVLACAAEIAFEAAEPERSLILQRRLLRLQGDDAPVSERAETLFRLGTSAAQVRSFAEAIAALQESLALDAAQPNALQVLSHCFEQQGLWKDMAETLYSELEFAEGERRYELLVELGDLALERLDEPEYAAQNYLTAHRGWPQDRRVLLKLLHVYCDLERWKSVVAVILKLVQLLDDPVAKARYYRTAALVAERKLGDVARGTRLLDEALALDPDAEDLVQSALKLSRVSGDGRRLAELLKREIRIASKHHDKGRMMAALGELADVYLNKMGSVRQAIAVHEGALELEPDNEALVDYLTRAYTAHPEQYLDKAIALNQRALDKEPLRAEAIAALRQLYAYARNSDATWCVVRVLCALELASGEELAFFERFKSRQGAVFTEGLLPEEWVSVILHPAADSQLTSFLAILAPSIAMASALGYPERYPQFEPINPIGHASPVLSSLAYIADVLAQPIPSVVAEPWNDEPLSLLPDNPNVLVVGRTGMDSRSDLREAAVVAARGLMRVLPGVLLHGLLGGTGELKVWFLAGLLQVHPHCEVPSELREDILTAAEWLEEQLSAEQVERLSWLSAQLTKEHAQVDLKAWGKGVDYTSDRLALLVCDDLDVVVCAIREAREPFAVASADERLAELCRYAMSEPYFALRRRLGIALG